MPRLKQRTPELRAHVLVAAEATLARGVEGFTTKQIATDAETSVPAIYEMFGDKNGLLRELFFVGFRKLATAAAEVPTSDHPRADVLALARAYRSFSLAHPSLSKLMFSQPFASFAPTVDDLAAADASRRTLVKAVRRCIKAGVVHGDAVDVSHVFLALVHGLIGQEAAGWLGEGKASCDRRWDLALSMFFVTGPRPVASGGARPRTKTSEPDSVHH